jgi:glutamate synthase (ferredoxin)
MGVFLSFISFYPFFSLFLLFFTLLCILFLHDILQKKHAIVHNFPIVGHLRYFLESIGPELRQYLVANDKEETPFNRDERSWIYATAKKQNNTFGFGTTELLYNTGYPIIKHKTLPLPAEKAKHFSQEDDTTIPCSKVLGGYHKRPKAFRPPSIINISAMSFGSLGYRAQSSLNQGAKVANCYHNTGEGAISPYHCFGADLVWQLGTGYFGTRDSEGNFCLETFKDKIQQHPQVKMIEIKLSQGAKPGKGGILPGAKVTPEIAEIRGIPVGETCYSPNTHSAFSTTDELITFTETLADASGLPVGIKSAIGDIAFWKELAQRMIDRNEGPDFISIDGSEGGTGAAPLTFSDHVSLPFKVGFSRVYKVFLDAQITDRVAFIGSGKLGFPDRTIIALAMGADMIRKGQRGSSCSSFTTVNRNEVWPFVTINHALRKFLPEGNIANSALNPYG